eukprot:TCONS_00063950-protein
MRYPYSLLKAIFGLFIITCCYEQKALSFTYRRTGNQHQLLPDSTDDTLTANLDIDTSEDLSSTSFIKKIDSNIQELEKDTSTKDLDLKAMENLDKTDESTNQRNTRHNTGKDQNTQGMSTKKTRVNKADRVVPSTVHAILNAPTNTMRAYLRSKTGLYLRMGPNGELGGTRKMKDKHVIFVIERMSKDAVRLKGEAANKYICINKRRKLFTREKPNSKCLLRSYLEENHYELFWSYMYSKKTDGENGWFLALKRNGKIRKPANTKIGDRQTMFFVHRADDIPSGS